MKYFAARRFRNASITLAALADLVAVGARRAAGAPADRLHDRLPALGGDRLPRALQPPQEAAVLAAGKLGRLAAVAFIRRHGHDRDFALHVGPNWPHGALNTALAAVYLLTIGSGFVGLYLSRTIPAQLARVGREVIYERIPGLRHQVRQQASELVLQSVAASGATTLADFYTTRLYDYFEQSRGWSYDLRPTSARRRALMREMHDIRRYLSDQEQSFCERLFALVRTKDDLDFHESRQRILKLWLFVHIGLTCSLVLLATLHGLLALAFAGGGA